MITVFGWQIRLPDALQFLGNVFGSFLATLIAWLLIALVAYLVFTYALRRLVRWFPGEVDDIILGIVRKPLFFLIVIFGALNSLEILQLSVSITHLLERIANSALACIIAFVLWRLLVDILLYYGESWVKKTESRIDDVIMPAVKLFGPLLIGLATLTVVLSIWGINVTSILVGAGVLALVLGLALQDTLSNIFGGINLLIDAPFRIGDLITLSDGKLCQVQRVGIRATELYHLEEHSTIYMPNKELANMVLANITRPTVDLKVTIEIGVAYGSDLDRVSDILQEIANAHPNVLGNIRDKMKALTKEATSTKSDQVENCSKMIEKLNNELVLDQQISNLAKEMRDMIATIKRLERGGLTVAELSRVHTEHVDRIEQCIQQVTKAFGEWNAVPDPWAYLDEQQTEARRWARAHSHLMDRWEKLKGTIRRPREKETRLDDLTQEFVNWIRTQYKLLPETWKEPQITFKSFGSSSVDLELDLYVDDIRLEHFERKQRVVTDIAKEIHKRFGEEGIEIPFPQMDVKLKSHEPD